jgi:hypothetical protein
MCNSLQPVRLVSVPEIARRARACSMTVSRFVERNEIQPDGLLVTTGSKPPVKCFVEPRAAQIEKQLAQAHRNQS